MRMIEEKGGASGMMILQRLECVVVVEVVEVIDENGNQLNLSIV